MCRLYGFRSSVTSGVHASLVAAENALAIQSVAHPDGWGVAFYQDRFPHLIRSEKQALDDGLFRELGAVVSTRTLIAHIRQATTGKLSVLNCHPFQFGPWIFAHNGQVTGYTKGNEIAEAVDSLVDQRFRGEMLGSTDSEALFYLFMSRLARRVEDPFHEGIKPEIVVDALTEMMEEIMARVPEPDPNEPNRLTFLVSNGGAMVGIRFRRSLHYSTYKNRCPDRDTCHAFEAYRCEAPVEDGMVKHLVISSERIAEGPNVWFELSDGEYVTVDRGMNFHQGRVAAFSDSPVATLATGTGR